MCSPSQAAAALSAKKQEQQLALQSLLPRIDTLRAQRNVEQVSVQAAKLREMQQQQAQSPTHGTAAAAAAVCEICEENEATLECA